MTGGGLDAILNVEDMRRRARRTLPRSVFEFIDGGAEDEVTVRENRAAMQRLWLRPRALADVGTVSLATTVLGHALSMPVMLGPCGAVHRFSRRGELAATIAAGRAGTAFVVHNASSYPIEVLKESASGPLWSQMYLPSERATAKAVLARTARAGVDVLCLTIDCPVGGNRERNYRNGLTSPRQIVPHSFRRRLIADAVRHPRWAVGWLRGRRATRRLMSRDRPPHLDFAHAAPVTARDVEWLRSQWAGRLVIKGVQRGEECDQLVDLGADAVIVSNHGGRHLDTARSTIEALPEVVAAINGRAEVYIDSGFRRGTDVVKALALGAKAVLIGRPYVFGLAAGGEAGVSRVLEIFRSEIALAMALSGCPDVQAVDASIVATRTG